MCELAGVNFIRVVKESHKNGCKFGRGTSMETKTDMNVCKAVQYLIVIVDL